MREALTWALTRIEIFQSTVCWRRCSIDFDASCVQSGTVLVSTVTYGPDLVYLANDCDSTILSVGGCTAELIWRSAGLNGLCYSPNP